MPVTIVLDGAVHVPLSGKTAQLAGAEFIDIPVSGLTASRVMRGLQFAFKEKINNSTGGDKTAEDFAACIDGLMDWLDSAPGNRSLAQPYVVRYYVKAVEDLLVSRFRMTFVRARKALRNADREFAEYVLRDAAAAAKVSPKGLEALFAKVEAAVKVQLDLITEAGEVIEEFEAAE